MDHEISESSTQPKQGNWITTVCIAALLVLCAVAVTMMVIGSQYGPPEQSAAPAITIDTHPGIDNETQMPADESEPTPATADEDTAPADPPNPSAE